MRTIILLFMFITPFASAYNFVGHVVIAEAAYQMLSPEEQQRLDELGALIKTNGSDTMRNSLSNYDKASVFARIAFLPDKHTGTKLGELYSNYGGTLPSTFEDIANKKTNQWHYINYPLANEECRSQFVKDDNVVWALDQLMDAYEASVDDESRAVTLAMIVHFVGDIHQPLHTVAKDLDPRPSACKNDRGGNLICLANLNSQDECSSSKKLHRYWDHSAELVSNKHEIPQYVATVLNQPKLLSHDIVGFEAWAKESYGHAEFVYTTPAGQWPSDEYAKETYRISLERHSSAAVRLSKLLSSILSSE